MQNLNSEFTIKNLTHLFRYCLLSQEELVQFNYFRRNTITQKIIVGMKR